MNHNSIIKEFYEKEGIKDKYKITLEECKLICSSPFKMVKTIFNNSVFVNIRFQYFGTFSVAKKRITYSIANIEKKVLETKDEAMKKRYKDYLVTLKNVK